MTQSRRTTAWPELPPLEAWEGTRAAVHMWSQMLGKLRLAGAPWTNHSWGSTLRVSARGLSTTAIHGPEDSFEVELDFVRHELRIETSTGGVRAVPLGPMSVASFHDALFEALADLGVNVRILARPVEVDPAIPFRDDHEIRPYDAEAIHRFWTALLRVARVFEIHRARFAGKASPVHFFWGAFDLAVTRFSGRGAPEHPGGAPNVADWVMREAYSDELASAGFWPGDGLGEAAFYAYAYPEPGGYRAAPVEPHGAYFHEGLGEFVLPYRLVRAAPDPEQALISFLESTYVAAADLARWDRARFERDLPAAWSER